MDRRRNLHTQEDCTSRALVFLDAGFVSRDFCRFDGLAELMAYLPA